MSSNKYYSVAFLILIIGIPAALAVGVKGNVTAKTYSTDTSCASAASPAVCGSAAAGAVTVAGGGATVVVNTTAVTASSSILPALQFIP